MLIQLFRYSTSLGKRRSTNFTSSKLKNKLTMKKVIETVSEKQIQTETYNTMLNDEQINSVIIIFELRSF